MQISKLPGIGLISNQIYSNANTKNFSHWYNEISIFKNRFSLKVSGLLGGIAEFIYMN